MNTEKTKGDILAERIRHAIEGNPPVSILQSEIRHALNEYHEPEWTLGRSVNGFTLAEGQEWHRNDFTKDMLPDGWRPLLKHEKAKIGDEYLLMDTWCIQHHDDAFTANHYCATLQRTLRPLLEVKKLVLTPAQIADGWIEWHGGDCPVWEGSTPEVMFRDGETKNNWKAGAMAWDHIGSGSDIIAYRPDPYEALKKAHSEGKVIQYKENENDTWDDLPEPTWFRKPECYRVKPSPVMVPLGPDDVKCGDVLRYIEGHFPKNMGEEWLGFSITAVGKKEISASGTWFSYHRMRDDLEINRNDGKGFVRCEKDAK